MIDIQWVLIGIFLVAILLIFMFRSSFKVNFGFLGIKFGAEATNLSKSSSSDAPKASPVQGDSITASGVRSVAVKEAQGAVINTGDSNMVAPPPKQEPKRVTEFK